MSGNKKYIHFAWNLFLMIIFLIISGQNASSQFHNYQSSAINWGVKVGFSALSNYYCDVYNGNTALSGITATNKVGYNISSFTKINFYRVYWQPEISWTVYKQNISFELPDDENTYHVPTSISIGSYSGNVNAVIGYYIVKERPYMCSLFLGMSLRCVYSNDYDIKNYGVYSTDNTYFKYTLIAGFSFHIAKTCFDVRYEISKPNTDVYLKNTSNIPESLENIYIRKNENIMSFSFGFIF
jgi:hypothetical protein